MNTGKDHSPSMTSRAHQFALDAMVETTISGVLSQLMKSLSTSNIDAIALSIMDGDQDRYLVASRGAMSTQARDRIRETLDALCREEQTDLMLPLIQTPIALDLSEVRRIEQTFESWYRQFTVGRSRLTLVTFHRHQQVVDRETRALLVELTKVVEATLVMIQQKENARAALVDGPQILLEVAVEGIEHIRNEFGNFEAEEILLGLVENIGSNLDAVTHVGQKDGHVITVMLPKTEQSLLSRLRLEIAETVRLTPAPEGHHLDALIRENVLAAPGLEMAVQTHRLHIPTPPSAVANGIRSIAN
jgi:hypothetical protein